MGGVHKGCDEQIGTILNDSFCKIDPSHCIYYIQGAIGKLLSKL